MSHNAPTRGDRSNSGSKRYRWQLVNTRNPKASVIRPAKADSAKEDLRRFVQENQLQYRRPRDDFTDFEDLFGQLRLNEDDELLERAERRDLPASVQLAARRQGPCESSADDEPTLRATSHGSSFASNSSTIGSASTRSCPRNRSVPPRRRSARPDTIYDDYAFRRYNQGSELRSAPRLSEGQPRASLQRANSISSSYLSLVTYDPFSSGQARSSQECVYCEGSMEHAPEEVCPLKQLCKYPDLVVDDVLNRRIRQSSAAKVAAPQPPFGIPNSPVNGFIHTFPGDYSRVEPDQGELRRRFRIREREPDLVCDDYAFRTLRKDYHLGSKLTDDDFWQGQLLDRTASTPDLAIKDLRLALRPLNPSSLTSEGSSSVSNSSPPASPIF